MEIDIQTMRTEFASAGDDPDDVWVTFRLRPDEPMGSSEVSSFAEAGHGAWEMDLIHALSDTEPGDDPREIAIYGVGELFRAYNDYLASRPHPSATYESGESR